MSTDEGQHTEALWHEARQAYVQFVTGTQLDAGSVYVRRIADIAKRAATLDDRQLADKLLRQIFSLYTAVGQYTLTTGDSESHN